jgi:hypothetical protein
VEHSLQPLTGSPGPRAVQASVRDDAIKAAGWELATNLIWPSPAAVAAKTGISESVVGRRTELLTKARRLWVKKAGRDHPQWKDPAKVSPVMKDAPLRVINSPPAKLLDSSKKDKIIRDQRRTIRDLTAKLQASDELNRRMNLEVRPSEITLLLTAGAKNKTKPNGITAPAQ